MSISIAEKIEKIRIEKGLTQPVFADEIEVSVNTYRAILKRGSSPRFDVVEKVAKRWPDYALWLLIEEDAPLAGQHIPGANIRASRGAPWCYQIVDILDRNLDASVIRPSVIDSAIFLHTTTEVPVSKRAQRIIDQMGWGTVNVPFPRDYNSEGTAILLTVAGDVGSGVKRAVLLPNEAFDLREIEQKGGVFGSLLELKNWLDTNGIRKFEVVGISEKTIKAVVAGMGEIKLSELQSPPEDVRESFNLWCKSFQS